MISIGMKAGRKSRKDATEPRLGHKLSMALLSAFVLLLALETAMQVRSHLRNGQSVLNAFTQETRYVVDPRTGLKVLRPNHVFVGSQVEMRTNSLGLRSPEISASKDPGTVRIAVIGASTVMGAYTSRNEGTFALRLDALLEASHPDRNFEVINAGIAGYGLIEQSQMLEKIILPLAPDLVIAYPGFNDFAGYCRSESDKPDAPKRPGRQGLPLVETPAWLLSIELLTKNTVALRTPPITSTSTRSVDSIDLTDYRKKLDVLGKLAQKSRVPVVLSSNARAYRPEQALAEQQALSETARYYNPCFDLDGLHKLYDLHNEEIKAAAARFELPFIPLDKEIPGGRTYFVDASHFSDAGEQLAAERLHGFLVDSALIPEQEDR